MRPRTLAAPLLLTIACAALTPTNASAQGADTSVDAAAEAKRQFVLGRQAFDAKRYADAAQNFEAAAAYKPHPVAFYTAAVAWELAGRSDRAADAFARAVDQPGLKEDDLKKAKERLSALEGVLGTVTVTAPEGWKLQLDGNTETPAPARLHGKPGLRALSYRAPGKGVEKKEVSLEAGQKLAISLPEPPPQVVTQPEPPKEEKKAPTVVVQGEDPFVTLKKSAGLVVAGLGAATLVGSAILWSQAQGAGDSYNAAPTRTALDHGESMETWTTITLVTGGVLLAGGVALYLVPIKVKSSTAASQSFRTAISPTLGGAMLRGQF